MQCNPYKNSTRLLVKMEMFFLKSIWKSKRPTIVKTVLKKKKIEELSLPDFQTYYKVWKILVLPQWLSNRLIKQNKEFRIRPACIWSTDFYKAVKESLWEKLNFLKWIMLGKLDKYVEKNELLLLSCHSPTLIQAES